jgi:hypothetical protein
MRHIVCSVVGTMALVLIASATPCRAQPTSVELVHTADGGWQLVRGGESYFIRGMGGSGSLELLAEMGGNSIRTWGIGADTQGILDEAHRLGLSVTLGIWLRHERHDFDYGEPKQVAEQFERAREAVLRYKDHPALLMWGVGNEMEGFGAGDNENVWRAVNDIARMIKGLDPHHPTMTVIAEVGGERVPSIHRLCPDIDVVGVNSYGGAPTVPQRYRAAGGTKPIVLTEFGPLGFWEVRRNDFGALVEPTSTQKAEQYRRAWEEGVKSEAGRLTLGGYAFLWGWKQEATPTWFGMLLPDGSRLAAADVMSAMWTGQPWPRPVPRIAPIEVKGSPVVEPGATVHAKVEVEPAAGQTVDVKWVLREEPEATPAGGDRQPLPPAFPEAIVESDQQTAIVQMPRAPGIYRLFVEARDQQGGAAVANVPLLVREEEPVKPPGRAVQLPLVLFGEEMRGEPYAPTGWMGETEAISLDVEWEENPHTGDKCIRVRYDREDGWGGIVWQDPPGDWGERPGGYDLTGSRKLTFWARGENGGERIQFEFGILKPGEAEFFDTATGRLDVELTEEWKQYGIDLDGKNLRRIKTGFVWVVAGAGEPITFYLDEIRYE